MAIDHKRVLMTLYFIVPIVYILFFGLSIVSFYIFSGQFEREKVILFMITYVSSHGAMLLFFNVFLFINYLFYIRFNLINSCIKLNFTTGEDDLKRPQDKHLSRIVMKLADLHDNLVDAVVKTNVCFSIQMMNIIAGAFAMDLTSLFAIYRVFVKNDVANFNFAVIQFIWSVFFMISGFSVIAISSLMTRTGKYTAVLVHKAINFIENEDDPIIENVS